MQPPVILSLSVLYARYGSRGGGPTMGLMKDLGYGKGYKYAHDDEGHTVAQQHLPDELAGERFYQPGTEGVEGKR